MWLGKNIIGIPFWNSERETERDRERQRDRETETERETDRDRERQTDRQTDRQRTCVQQDQVHCIWQWWHSGYKNI